LEKYKHTFDIVIAADTLWMDYQHENLVDSILFFLKEKHNSSHDENEGLNKDDTSKAKAIVVAGLHTGRKLMSGFWDVVVKKGLVIESLVERDIEGKEREFLKDRGPEDSSERKRWLTIGILSRG